MESETMQYDLFSSLSFIYVKCEMQKERFQLLIKIEIPNLSVIFLILSA